MVEIAPAAGTDAAWRLPSSMCALNLSQADSDKLAELIKDAGVAMVTTVAGDGALRSRPMASTKHGFDGALWFFSADDSGKAGEIAVHEQVNVSFAEPKHERYVSLSGRARLLRDAAKAKEMWNPLLKGWFPGGLEDPRLALLRVEIEHAEYWDAKSSRMLVFLSLARAAVTGHPPDHLGEHKKVG
jgi:general stress protein 26